MLFRSGLGSAGILGLAANPGLISGGLSALGSMFGGGNSYGATGMSNSLLQELGLV